MFMDLELDSLTKGDSVMDPSKFLDELLISTMEWMFPIVVLNLTHRQGFQIYKNDVILGRHSLE